MPSPDKQKAYAVTRAWHLANYNRRILVQRAYNYRTRIERKIARGLGIRIDEARKLLNA